MADKASTLAKIDLARAEVNALVITVPDPVPSTIAPTISRYQINNANLLCLEPQFASSAYERFQRHVCLTTSAFTFKIRSLANGGPKTFAFTRYGIFISPNQDMSGAVCRASANVSGNTFTLNGTLGNEVDGPYFARALPVNASDVPLTLGAETYPVFGFWIDRNGSAKNHSKVIGQNGSFTWAHGVTGAPVYSDVVLLDKATVLTPQPLPLPARLLVTGFNTAISYTQIARVPLVPNTDAIDQDRHQPCLTSRGITVIENTQNYQPGRMFDDFPVVPLLDGPRGVCTAPYSTVLKPSERPVSSGSTDKVYVCSPWSLAVMNSTGQKTTLFGLRHRAGMVPYWEEAVTSITHPALEIIGDFDSSIPLAERYPLESWFLVWDRRSLIVDLTAPLINGDPPHKPYTLPSGEIISGPRCFLGDRRGWIWELRFSGTDRTAPAKVRKWITGVNDPWGGDNMPTMNTFAIAQRSAHRIDEWSMDVPNTLVRNLIQSTGTGLVQSARGGRTWTGDHVLARTFSICGPESVRIKNNILTVGSLAQERVRAFDATTLALLGDVATPTMDYGGVGSFFVDHDRSDGTFGPLDTVFTVTFSNSYFGQPEAFIPGGTKWHYIGAPFGVAGYGVDRGKGGAWNNGHYPTTVGVAQGRMYGGNSGGGIDYYCKADAYDMTVDMARAQRGWEDYRKAGLSIIHGPYAVNRNGYVIAKGVNADRDYWYSMLGV